MERMSLGVHHGPEGNALVQKDQVDRLRSAYMKAANVTHGGFHGHFTSKDDLVAQASCSEPLPDNPILADKGITNPL
jgi:hypothetical protein